MSNRLPLSYDTVFRDTKTFLQTDFMRPQAYAQCYIRQLIRTIAENKDVL